MYMNFRTNTEGDICTMRIIVDKFLLGLYKNDRQTNCLNIMVIINNIDRSELKNVIKLHEYMLNSIYRLNGIKIKNRQLSFKVVDIQFQDEQFCRTNINHGKCRRKAKLMF